jgi:hypothetical protein
MTRSGIALFAAALVLPTLAARTAPLDKDNCARLKVEEAQLEQAGTRTSMMKGAEWAKANLPADKLEQIRRFIEVEEQLLFRCNAKNLVNLPKDPDPDPASRDPDATDDAKEPVAKAPVAKQPKKKAAAVKDDGTAAPPVTPKVKAEPKPKPEPKVKAEPKAKPEAKPKTDAAEPTADAGTERAAARVAPAAAAKAKAKPKLDDAYRAPTPTEPNSDPFASNRPGS